MIPPPETTSLNIVWTLLAAFLVMFMQAGFALVATGLCRAKSAAHTMSMNFMIYALGVLGFWFCGFAFAFGGSGVAALGFDAHPSLGTSIAHLDAEWTIRLGGHAWGLLGHRGFLFSPRTLGAGAACFFVFQTVFMSITATIPTGVMAERWHFKNFMLYGLWVGMIGYAVFGNWVWGGGWLSQLGAFAGLGHGHVDFAGSSVAHLTGGVIGAVGASVLGPRLGKFKADGTACPIPGHNIPYVVLGTFILAFGWFGFNPGSTLAGTDAHIAAVALNTMLASAAGACFAAFGMYFRFGKPDPSVMCNGMLAGLVAITASCGFVSSTAAVEIGAVAGLLVIWALFFVERVLKIDDPVGAISVHAVNGFWGILALGLLADGSYGQGWNGVHKLFKDGRLMTVVNDGTAAARAQFTAARAAGWIDQGVTGGLGKLYGAPYNDWSQFGAELIGGVTNLVVVGLFAWGWFSLANRLVPMRSKRQDEIVGLDIPEIGAEAYSDYHLTDASSPRVEGSVYRSL
jgi:Amt family ammonium transporter